jgi:1,4-alpha-glucan branching enzyme
MEKEYRILRLDPYLRPFAEDIRLRVSRYAETRRRLTGDDGVLLKSVVNGELYYGFHPEGNGWVYREWAPNAQSIALMGDFNQWNDQTHLMRRLDHGNWELLADGPIPHGSRVRLKLMANGRMYERIPLYCKRVVQDAGSKRFDGVIWSPSVPYSWRDQGFTPGKPLYLYECHIGMSGEQPKVTTFSEFADQVLPRVKKSGYTAIQIMAVMEHPYYGSFGYQVSNLFAVSSRFGTPDEFMALVDRAHSMGIAVIMDLVHSHVARNTEEGLAEFDGTDYQFCHHGGRGDHPGWNTRLYDYGKLEVLHFLLSNVKYWMTEYHLDGFRFDGVTSMLYLHHGLGVAFDHYGKHFSMDTDLDAITYLQLAAALVKEIRPDSILIAEDMSGMPGMCLPIPDGGIGFDYRLGMGLPDFLIKLMKTPDESWRLATLWYELTTRRPEEKVVGYTESHDQALVGDKTLIFWMADEDMYWHMKDGDGSERVDRAMALHKMLRLIVCAAGGDGYLNFMGNEFGHPEWIDFPREGNGWSHEHARRQWSLADNPELKYKYLLDFDAAMLSFFAKDDLFEQPARFLFVHESDKILAFEKGPYTFIFNFHPQKSYVYNGDNGDNGDNGGGQDRDPGDPGDPGTLGEFGEPEGSDRNTAMNRLEPEGPKTDRAETRRIGAAVEAAAVPWRSGIAFHTAWKRFGGFVDEQVNEGLIREDGVVVDRRTAVVLLPDTAAPYQGEIPYLILTK